MDDEELDEYDYDDYDDYDFDDYGGSGGSGSSHSHNGSRENNSSDSHNNSGGNNAQAGQVEPPRITHEDLLEDHAKLREHLEKNHPEFFEGADSEREKLRKMSTFSRDDYDKYMHDFWDDYLTKKYDPEEYARRQKEKAKQQNHSGKGNKKSDKGKKGNDKKDNDRKGLYRKTIGNLGDNIKGALEGNTKDKVFLVIKLGVVLVIVIIIFIALIMEGTAKESSKIVVTTVSNVINESVSEINKELFNNTGSLLMATDSELDKIRDGVMENIKSTSSSIHSELATEYSNKKAETVSNKVQHITTNLANNEVAEVEKIDDQVKKISDEARINQKRTILEHILRTEKYNFNNIVWRSYVKDKSNNLKEEKIEFVVDSDTKLKYPSPDAKNIDSEEHHLMFFVNKTRSYLQSWQIPFDLLIGTTDSGNSDENINTKFAYEILAKAYHEVVVDRYKIEKLTRKNNYIVYDEVNTTITVTRICEAYEVDGNSKVYCYDTSSEEVETTSDNRKSVEKSEGKSYRWDYVVSMAKMFDTVISEKYDFVPYNSYSRDNYDKFINKKDEYKDMTVEEFEKSELENSKAESLTHQEKDYYEKTETKKTTDTWNSDKLGTPPAGAVKIDGLSSSRVVSKVVVEEKKGKEYTDSYVWNDKLELSEYKTGIYNIDSVKDVTGDDLTSQDMNYYESLYYGEEINLVDLMNSDKDIYSNYLSSGEMKSSTQNLGISKTSLSLAYDVLRDDLSNLLLTYPLNSIKYGKSLGLELGSFAILDGVNFGSIANIAAGSMEGKNVAYPISTEDLSNSRLQVKSKYGNSYGYEGHTGVDISYNYSAADKSLCNDYTNSVCPYMKGPEIYTMMDGVIKEVGYSSYNKYYKAGKYSGNSTQGNLKINDTSGWGTYVKMKNTDGSYTIYSHLFPDKEFYKQMSEMIDKPISAGTFIGYMGNTGNSSGLHLHVEFSSTLGGFAASTANSSNTYIYLMKIIDAMKIKPPKS